jgi:hypothetical protein
MWGAYLTIGGIALVSASVPLSAVGFAVIYAIVGTSALGYVLGRTVVLPLAGKPSLAMLIATIGLAIVLEELMRIANGGRELWLRPILAETLIEFPDPGFTIRISVIQAVVLWAHRWSLPAGLPSSCAGIASAAPGAPARRTCAWSRSSASTRARCSPGRWSSARPSPPRAAS